MPYQVYRFPEKMMKFLLCDEDFVKKYIRQDMFFHMFFYFYGSNCQTFLMKLFPLVYCDSKLANEKLPEKD